MTSTVLKIAVIGPSQSGKTCLATGLFNVNRRRRLSVEAPNQEAKEYLESRTQELENGDWPGATSRGTRKDIQLVFCARRKSTRVSFIEFAGEILAKDETFRPFANEHFHGLDGVVLLVNPGAEAFSSPERSDKCLAQYHRVLDYFLTDPNNGIHPCIALVVTAADRLKSDLKNPPSAALFRKCLEDLENRLSNHVLDWKTFKVTVTGHLKEGQGKPQLAPRDEITAAEPFLWLVDRITKYPKRAKKMKFLGLMIVAAVVLALLLGTGAHLWRRDVEGKQLKECKEALECLDDSKPNDMRLEKACKAMKTLETKDWSSASTNEVAMLIGRYRNKFMDARCGQAIRHPDLVELAELLREAETDMAFKSWADRLEKAYSVQYTGFIYANAENIVNRKSPKVAEQDELTIRQKAAEVGRPFDAEKAIKDLKVKVQELADPRRRACEKWKDENIRSTNVRSGPDGLLRKYIKARDEKGLNGNPFFDEIVRRAVYDQYGRWLLGDVADYPSQIKAELFDDRGKKVRKEACGVFKEWLENFYKTCTELAGKNDPSPDTSSWAYQFAIQTKERKCFPDEYLDAFPQSIVITNVECWMDYSTNFPCNYDGTEFRAELQMLKADWTVGETVPILDGEPRVLQEEEEKLWISVWSKTNEFRYEAGLFQMALCLEAIDKQPWWSTASSETYPVMIEPVAWLEDAPCWEFEKQVERKRITGAGKITFKVRVYGKLEKPTPRTLAEEISKKGWRKPKEEGPGR